MTATTPPPFPYATMERAREIVGRAFDQVCDRASDKEKAAEAEWWRRRNTLVGWRWGIPGRRAPETGEVVLVLPSDPSQTIPTLHIHRHKLEAEGVSLAEVIAKGLATVRALNRESLRRHALRADKTLTQALKLAKRTAPDLPCMAVVLAHEELCLVNQVPGSGSSSTLHFNWLGAVAYIHALVTRAPIHAPSFSPFHFSDVHTLSEGERDGLIKDNDPYTSRFSPRRAAERFALGLVDALGESSLEHLLPTEPSLARHLHRIYAQAVKDPADTHRRGIDLVDALPPGSLSENCLDELLADAVRIFFDVYPGSIPFTMPPIRP